MTILGRPFRPPLLKSLPSEVTNNDEAANPPAKRRRISEAVSKSPSTSSQLVFKVPGISSLPRKPLISVKNPAAAAEATAPLDAGLDGYYNVLWRKFTAKKHKTWDGDGVLRVTGGYAYLQDISGRDMGRIVCNSPLLPGSSLSIGSREVEVDSVLSKAEFMAGRPFLGTSVTKPKPPIPHKVAPRPRPKVKVVTKDQDKSLDAISTFNNKTSLNAAVEADDERTKTFNKAAPQSLATKAQWKNPILANTIMPQHESNEPIPRHDPKALGALVMKRPKTAPKGKQVVDVVVDPLLTKHLREHQRHGVEFMYECVMGMRDFDGQGAILADEMGLGKTLQTIALLWTLLKQNPIYEDAPVIKKALIVCPVTLINNWRKEFRKWLGLERIGVFVADSTKTRLTDFTHGKSYSVMIIGYEKLRIVQEELKKGPGIDIVIADEGHRLKTAQNKSAQAIKALNTPRRVILSGTPIQNDLSEFFMMVDFVNPGLLGSFKTFTKEFETPIVRSRQPGALKKDIEKGEARSEELASLTTMFILRRTAEILSKYLPPKTEYVLLCRPTPSQTLAYQHVLGSPVFQSALGNPEASLQLLTILKKVCNSPTLLNPRSNPDKPMNPMTASLLSSVPAQLRGNPGSSSKLRVLDQLLHTLRTATSEKVVIVSNYTSTLDYLQQFLDKSSHPFVRLDGTTPSSKRQEIVDTFNRTPASLCFAFLLSAKAGAIGLNLIGGSRLILFDIDWNPATDLQAMARIHRDGQKRACVIYRLFLAGALDEKIWQRQVTKLGLASSVMDQKAGGMSCFSREELKDLFRLDEGPSCQTHDLLGCHCGGMGLPLEAVTAEQPIEVLDSEREDEDLPEMGTLVKASELDMDKQEYRIRDQVAKARAGSKMESLMAYSHIDTSAFARNENEEMEALIKDEVLLDVLKDEACDIPFVFAKTSGCEV